jgi:hypothetical protein
MYEISYAIDEILNLMQSLNPKIGHYCQLCGLINQLPFDHKAKYRAHTFCYIL